MAYTKSEMQSDWNEFLVVESIIDPYGLVEKINRITQTNDGQKMIEITFDSYLASDDPRAKQLLVSYFKKVGNMEQVDRILGNQKPE